VLVRAQQRDRLGRQLDHPMLPALGRVQLVAVVGRRIASGRSAATCAKPGDAKSSDAMSSGGGTASDPAQAAPTMGILSWIVLGLIASVLAKFLLPGDDPGGLIITVLLGIGGAFVGGWIGTRLGIASFNGFTWQGLGVATAGAAVLLLLYRLVKKR
jgi:uncharacterized membrane protein YeaQ/YmgE (transglycosylase-associated protein family)